MKEANYNTDMESLVIRYLDGDISDVELDAFHDWLNESEDNQHQFHEIRDMHLALKEIYKNDDKLWTSFTKEIKKIKTKRIIKNSFRYAAVFLLGIGITFSVMKVLQSEKTPKTFVCNTYGLPATMTLSDGTYVKLGANSSITYTSDFNSENRNVKLYGEGFFAVAKNKQLPFTVNARQNMITVTGTKFDVNARESKQFIVTLLEGGVMFSNAKTGARTQLTPGRTLIYNEQSGRMSLLASNATIDDYLSYNHTFYSEPLSSILERMGNVYGVKFECSNQKALNKQYRTIFNNGETLESFLEVMNSLTGLKTKQIDENTIKLYQ